MSVSEIKSRLEIDMGKSPSKSELARAVEYASKQWGAAISYLAPTHAYQLENPEILALIAPGPEHLVALSLAIAVLERLGPGVDDLIAGLKDLVAGIDLDRRSPDAAEVLGTDLVTTASIRPKYRPEVLKALMMSANDGIMSIRYEKPWTEDGAKTGARRVEPWALRVHNGELYLRAFTNGAKAGRTYNLASIRSAKSVARARQGQRPALSALWGSAPLDAGIFDGPARRITISIKGGAARFHADRSWFHQLDQAWDVDRGVLTKTFEYTSKHELIPALLGLGENLVSVDDEEIRAALARNAAALVRATTGNA